MNQKSSFSLFALLAVLLLAVHIDGKKKFKWNTPPEEWEAEGLVAAEKPAAEVEEPEAPAPPPSKGKDTKKAAAHAKKDADDDDEDDDDDEPAPPPSKGKDKKKEVEAKKDEDDDEKAEDEGSDTKVEDAKDEDEGDQEGSEAGSGGDEDAGCGTDRPYCVADLLHLNEDDHEARRRKDILINEALGRLNQIVNNQIHPLEKMYKYEHLAMSTFGEPEIFAKPLVLVMEPYKRGKSSLLPLLLGDTEIEEGDEIENTDFVIYSHASKPRTLEGIQVLRNETFESLQRFGKSLASHLKAIELPHPLLERVTLVETPDVLENSKLDREFPVAKVHQWFVARADAIILIVEPDRVDVGETLEAVFKELKDQEDLLLVLIEAGYKTSIDDSVKALRKMAWSFAPHFDVNEAPHMYITSFEKPLDGECSELYGRQERQFLVDLHKILDHRFKNRLTTVYERAVDVRNHAFLVDKFLDTFIQKKSFFGSNNKALENDIANFPSKFGIYEAVLRRTNASADDLPDPEEYKAFFKTNNLQSFKSLASGCSFMGGCPSDKITNAILYDLPELLEKFTSRLPLCVSDVSECTLEDKKFVPAQKKKKAH
ncbi:Sarcalumenin [Hypsibius exemplaris]|uniref:Sarcalumenin n=1 Tax=Hypsibius exemplaris TaxID=2072580 RepID=A0A1W0XFG4_HYPEX|nr:Sarcalumenin [Hypsibius exemplaris]